MARLVSKRTDLFHTAGLRARTRKCRRANPSRYHLQGDVANIGDQLRTFLNCLDFFDSAFNNDGIAASLPTHWSAEESELSNGRGELQGGPH